MIHRAAFETLTLKNYAGSNHEATDFDKIISGHEEKEKQELKRKMNGWVTPVDR